MTEKIKNDRDLILIFAHIYLFIKRYYIILLIFILTGIAYGYYKNHTSGFYYKKHLAFSSIVIEKEISIDIIKSIQLLIDESNTSAIAKKLNIPDDAAASIMKIDTSTFRNKQNLGFIVDVTFRDSIYADTITSGLLYFLNTNDYYSKKVELYLKEKQTVLENINNSLKLNKTDAEGINTIVVKTYTPEQMLLLEEKYETEKEIEFGSKVMLLDETMAKVSTGIGLMKSIILYGLGFCFVGIFISLFIESIRLTRAYLK